MNEKSYGVTLQAKLDSEIDGYVEEVKINGFSVIENVLSVDELIECRVRLDDVYDHQKENYGEDNLIRLNEKDLARCLLVYDNYFLNLATNAHVIKVIEKILGDYFILHLQNGIINRPNEEHHQSSWHRDLPYQNFVISKPLSVNALYCIDDFTVESGSTFILPYSHKVESIPSDQFISKHSKQLIAKAGSVVIFDSMLFHKAGYNSSDFRRRAINNVYCAPILKQQIDLPAALKGKYSDDPFLSKFLGYKSNPPSSDIDWRNNRLNR